MGYNLTRKEPSHDTLACAAMDRLGDAVIDPRCGGAELATMVDHIPTKGDVIMGAFQASRYAALKTKPRLWPYVLVGIVVAMLLLASFEPIPHPLTNAERIWFCQSDLHC